MRTVARSSGTLRGALLCLAVLAGAGVQAQERALSYSLEQSEAGTGGVPRQLRHVPRSAPERWPAGQAAEGAGVHAQIRGPQRPGPVPGDPHHHAQRQPGSLDAATYAALVAYMLQQNAIVAGSAALPSDAADSCTNEGSGRRLQHHGPTRRIRRRSRWCCPIRWTTSRRSASLIWRIRPPQDWLTWRRGWNAHGFSPLTQITAANAANLRLSWVGRCPAGSAEAVPLVRDGTLFVLELRGGRAGARCTDRRSPLGIQPQS